MNNVAEVLKVHELWLKGYPKGEKANLRGADLQGANLWDANLQYADLQDADLQDANLQYADLQGANLQYADLQGANLRGVNLQGANLQGARLPHFQIPQHGELRVWKKVQGKLVHLVIPPYAKRTATPVGRKCRASKAKVLSIQGDMPVSTRGLAYVVGKTVFPDSYDDDIRVECTHGIHFFLTREEAEGYVG